MKNLATLALIGLVRAQEINNFGQHNLAEITDAEIEIDETDCSGGVCPLDIAVCCPDSHSCCPEGFTCVPDSNECSSDENYKILASLLKNPIKKNIEYDTEAVCAGFVNDFAMQPDWYIIGPEGGVTKLEII